MSGYETITDKPTSSSNPMNIPKSDSYQGIPQLPSKEPQSLVSLGFVELPIPPQYSAVPAPAAATVAIGVGKNSPEPQRNAPRATDYKVNNSSSQYGKPTIEFKRVGETILVSGKTYDVKDILKTLGSCRWDKPSNTWTLSGMGANIEHVMYALDIIKTMQMKDMIKAAPPKDAKK